MQKICISCSLSKDINEFGKNSKSKDNYQSRCKECKRLYDNNYHHNRSELEKDKKYNLQKIRINKIKEYIKEYFKDKKCSICNENRMAALDFHHLNDKKFNISEGISNGYSLIKIKDEISKCKILCANCHRVQTAEDFNWYCK